MLLACSSGSRDHREKVAPSSEETETVSQPAPTQAVEAPVQPAGRTYRIPLRAGTAASLVHKTSKKDEVVLLELFSNKIMFTALISRRKFEEVMTLKPPTYFQYNGLDFVRNDGMLFSNASANDRGA